MGCSRVCIETELHQQNTKQNFNSTSSKEEEEEEEDDEKQNEKYEIQTIARTANRNSPRHEAQKRCFRTIF